MIHKGVSFTLATSSGEEVFSVDSTGRVFVLTDDGYRGEATDPDAVMAGFTRWADRVRDVDLADFPDGFVPVVINNDRGESLFTMRQDGTIMWRDVVIGKDQRAVRALLGVVAIGVAEARVKGPKKR